MWTLSGFADEIAPDFSTQCVHVHSLGVTHIELRSAWGVNVLDLTDDQLDDVSALLTAYELSVSSIGSPIGKILITDPFEPHVERMRRALAVAKRLGAPYIRIFSFFIPEGEDPDQYRDEVVRRLTVLVRMAQDAGVILLHENEKEIFGDIPRRCADLARTIDSPNLRLILDPANYVQCGVRPVSDGYDELRPFTAYVHVKDALSANGEVVPAGEGDGEVRSLLHRLSVDGFDGFFSLEPHLAAQDSFGGFSGPEQWTRAHTAFTGLLADEGIVYA
jgi:sugar phosphate isomerase/epimerase